MAKCHRLGSLNDKHLFLGVLEAVVSKIKVLADWLSGDGPLLGLHMASFLLYPQVAQRE